MTTETPSDHVDPGLRTPHSPEAAGPPDDRSAAALARTADTWLARGLATDPADRATAEAAVRQAYAGAGLATPETIIWLGSPYAGALAAALLTDTTSGAAGPGGFGAAGPGGPSPATSPPGGDPDKSPTGRALAEVTAAIRAQGHEPHRVVTGRSVRARLRTAPWAEARADAVTRLGPAGWAAHWAAGGQRTWHLLNERLVTPLRTRLTDELTREMPAPLVGRARTALLDVVFGQHDAAWLSAFDNDPRVAGLAGVADAAGWWWPYERVVIMTERPVRVERDNLGRLHHGDGPALVYPDGFGLHAWRGMPIPADVAAELPRLTVERIRAERNAEVRRVMLEHFGYDRYLRESKARAIHRDAYGVLWRIELPQDEPLVMVEVVNATPEPDGTSRTYWLRVPPQTRTARAGVAWTFGLTEQEYAPLVQT
ncbi:hypothetical protein BDK92_1330 [Micromonospora pisi]|uniref:DUF6745 domain-containing protein n=1 Tax=Micromonospora pisi TaxID=589240 RepID=A0A495JEV7_9ACTN|nr:hypothetical protein [Micromonospora pisi]RKR87058.1 hypothetical protein BDK92_1330 [Micromonospora pisi]